MKKHIFILLGIGTTSMLLAGNNGSQNQNQKQSMQQPFQTKKAFATDDDRYLYQDIKDALGRSHIAMDHITIEINHGNVTINGSANTPGDKKQIEQTIRNVPGVHAIDNQIGMPNQPQMDTKKDMHSKVSAPSDRYLARAVRDALIGSEANVDNISIEVIRGNVTLLGFTTSAASKKAIEGTARIVDGVKNISNQISVSEDHSKMNANQTNTQYVNPQDYAATSYDQQINSQIHAALPNFVLVLKTTNGNVVVEGDVEHSEDIQKVADEIKKVKGVRSVNNLLFVKVSN